MNLLKKKASLRFINCLVFSLAVLLVKGQSAFGQNITPQVSCQGSSNQLINQAQEVTVQLKSTENDFSPPIYVGSGVLVKGKSGVYVVTSKHLSNDASGFSSSDYIEILCQDFAQDFIHFDPVATSDKNSDVALLRPKIQRDWKTAEIALEPAAIGETILVSGFPLEQKTNGKFKSIYTRVLNSNNVKSQALKNTDSQQFLYYKPIEENKTIDINGLSGGSILNSSGKLIGIQADFDKNQKEGKAISSSVLQQLFANQLGMNDTSTQTASSQDNVRPETDGSKLPSVRAFW